MEQKNRATTRRRTCLLVFSISAAILLAAILIVVILAFTAFKPRNPVVILFPVGLKSLSLTDLIIAQNVTTKMIIQITNSNRARFKFRNATSLVYYGDDDLVVGEVPVIENEIPERTTVNLTTSAVLMASKMKTAAVADIATGKVNLTSRVTLYGKSLIFGVKVKTSVYTECYLTVVINRTFSGTSWCWSKLKMN
ncbi:hypothetical protein LINPERPRIM_LOCUS3597 [Linum perenne]